MTTHFLKLPSGDFLNLAAIAHVENLAIFCRVHFNAAGSLTIDGSTDIYLAYKDYTRDDLPAIIAALTAQAAENEAIRELYRQVVAGKQEAAK